MGFNEILLAISISFMLVRYYSPMKKQRRTGAFSSYLLIRIPSISSRFVPS
jgi:hypothetical protein